MDVRRRLSASSPARSRSPSAAASSPARRSTGSRRRSGRSSGTRSASRCSTPTRSAKLVDAGTSERWRAALGLAGYAGLRLGEIRALTLGRRRPRGGHGRRAPLAAAGRNGEGAEDGGRGADRAAAARRCAACSSTWKLRSPHTRPTTSSSAPRTGSHVAERNLRRALDDAKTPPGSPTTDDRLSWHSLRHSFASMLATDLELPATTLARLTGHADAGFTLRVYARDGRDEAARRRRTCSPERPEAGSGA